MTSSGGKAAIRRYSAKCRCFRTHNPSSKSGTSLARCREGRPIVQVPAPRRHDFRGDAATAPKALYLQHRSDLRTKGTGIGANLKTNRRGWKPLYSAVNGRNLGYATFDIRSNHWWTIAPCYFATEGEYETAYVEVHFRNPLLDYGYLRIYLLNFFFVPANFRCDCF